MKKLIAGCVFGLGMISTVVLGQIAISQLPSAGLPLIGTEVVSGVQNGGTVKIPVWSILSPYISVAAGFLNFTTGVTIGSPTGGNLGNGWLNVASGVAINNKSLGPSGYASSIVNFTGTGTITAATSPQKIYVNKRVPAATTVILPAASNFTGCGSVNYTCPVYTVKDFAANSGTYPITVEAADSAVLVAGNTSATTYVIQSNGAANTFQLVGSTWAVE